VHAEGTNITGRTSLSQNMYTAREYGDGKHRTKEAKYRALEQSQM